MTYEATRATLETYFDRTAAETWARLTSEAPVSRIRQTVRAGRDRMRALLLARLPADMTGTRLLDAGCGVGQLAVEAARRGAEVTAVDISPNLLEIAARRTPSDLARRIDFRAADMLDPRLGRFDHVVAMDSLIHYGAADIVAALAGLAPRTGRSLLFTVAPATPLLQAMHFAGKAFPRSDRSPKIRPLRADRLAAALGPDLGPRIGVAGRIASGFYISEALELDLR